MDERWKLDAISNEEDGGVVSNEVPVALLGFELDTETTRISSGVCRTLLTTDR
jgi:hypothetical protein